MKKSTRFLSLLLSIVMILGILPVTSLAVDSTGLDNFKKVNSYNDSTYTDVKSDDWFYENVKAAFEYGLMVGTGNNQFDTDGNVTIAETLTIAARLHSVYYTGEADFEESEPWYQVYADYCKENGIVEPDLFELTASATRAQFTQILANAMPDEAWERINKVADHAIPDVEMEDSFSAAVYKLYRAGVLIGNDANGTFAPDSNIGRSEVSAIVTRTAIPSMREAIQLGNEYTVSFDLNYYDLTLKTITVFEGEQAAVPEDPERYAHEFRGWYTLPYGGDLFDFNTGITEDMTLYAQWDYVGVYVPTPVQDTYYTVTFDTNGGSAVESQQVKAGECAVEPEEPTKDGYVFDGWCSDSELKSLYDFAGTVNENLTLYALWIPKNDNLTDDVIDLGDIVDLETNNIIEVIYNDDGSISSIIGPFTDKKVTSSQEAADVLNSASSLFGDDFSADPEQINVQSVGEAGNDTELFYRFGAEKDGIPVIGSQIVLTTDADGNVTGLFTSYDEKLNLVDTTPDITSEEATQAALELLLQESNMVEFMNLLSEYAETSEDEMTFEEIMSAYIDSLNINTELSIYAADTNDEPVLVYAVSINTYCITEDEISAIAEEADSSSELITAPVIDCVYYIYANGSASGSLYKYIDMTIMWDTVQLEGKDALGATRTFTGQEENGTYRLKDTTRNITTYKTKKNGMLWWVSYELPGTIAESSSFLWSDEYMDKIAISAHANITHTYDFYNNTLGRRSFDGNGAAVKVSYNYGSNYKNAYWTPSGQQFVFGSGDDYAAALDIVAHEFTHGVISYVCGSGYDTGLIYSGETGALNEAYADILGNLVEGKTGANFWAHGEDKGSVSRDLSNPSKYHQPEHYSALSDASWSAYLNNFKDRDYEGVHIFNSVFTFAFYKMVTDNRCSSISYNKWANVFYRSLFRLTSDATFLDGRGAVIASAKALGFNHDQQQAVKDAFDAVGISEPDSVRIILTWGSSPADLDSHLVGPGVNGDRFHIYYGNRSYYEDGSYTSNTSQYVADLDYDDVTSYGPEVTTIHVFTDGDYYFYVHDYTNYSSATSTEMANSGATIRVFWGSSNQPKATYHIDTSSSGVYWNVFKLTVSDSVVSSIQEINTYGATPTYN